MIIVGLLAGWKAPALRRFHRARRATDNAIHKLAFSPQHRDPTAMSDEYPSLPENLSAEDRAKLHRAARQAYRVEDLPDEAIKAIEMARYSTDADLAKLTQ